jgi:hypothetical protein
VVQKFPTTIQYRVILTNPSAGAWHKVFQVPNGYQIQIAQIDYLAGAGLSFGQFVCYLQDDTSFAHKCLTTAAAKSGAGVLYDVAGFPIGEDTGVDSSFPMYPKDSVYVYVSANGSSNNLVLDFILYVDEYDMVRSNIDSDMPLK